MELPDKADFAVAEVRSLLIGQQLQRKLREVYVTFRRPIKSSENVQQRTLTRAGLAHNRQHFPQSHNEGQIFKDHQPAFARPIFLLQILDPKKLYSVYWMQVASPKEQWRCPKALYSAV